MSQYRSDVHRYVFQVANDSVVRLTTVTRRGFLRAAVFLSIVSGVSAQDLNTMFTPRPAETAEEINGTQADVRDVVGLATWRDLQIWRKRGQAIRDSGNLIFCVGNLSLAVSEIGPVAAYSGQGASGALSLLPTAGALIGAPSKELWVLYKLMPLAGVLSMILSLGGNIIPMHDTDYRVSSNAFSYGGFIATNRGDGSGKRSHRDKYLGSAEVFAAAVAARAEEVCVANKRGNIAFGIFTQFFWIAVLLGTAWTVQNGSIVTWWCSAWGWMYFWLLLVAFSSLLENFAGVPFTKQWTIRVSKAPKLHISDAAPYITSTQLRRAVNRSESLVPDQRDNGPVGKSYDPEIRTETTDRYRIPRRPVHNRATPDAAVDLQDPLLPPRRIHSDHFEHDNDDSEGSIAHRSSNADTPPVGVHPSSQKQGVGVQIYPTSTNASAATAEYGSAERDILSDLATGFNSTSTVFMDPNEPYTVPCTPFYVIISLKGISAFHATLRVFAKAVTVAVFATGTATFASVTLLTISVALMALCIVLAAGVMSRVAALWMASEMMKMNPVLHRVLDTRQEVAEYIEAMLGQRGLVFEVMGHVIIDGRSVSRYNKWLQWSNLFGVLAPPFNVSKIALGRR